VDAKLNTERNHAFVVRLADLKKLWDLLQSRIGAVTISAKCGDKIERTFDNYKQLKGFENSPQKRVVHLSLNSRSDDWKKTAQIDFSDSPYRVIDIRLSGSEQLISRLHDDIIDILDGTRPWYSRLSKIDFFYVISFLVWPAFAIANILQPENSNPPKVELTIELTLIIVAVVTVASALIIMLAWLLNKFRARFFPIATFAIGQGEERYRTDDKIRWTILIGFLVSLSASLVVAAL